MPEVCERGLCARIVERETSMEIVVDVTAPANVSLHNAWVAETGAAACRGGRALHTVATDGGTLMHGPLPLPASTRLKLMFGIAFTSGTSLDLDVRSPDGIVCLRVPFAPAAADAGAARIDGSEATHAEGGNG
jgi:hypothetical protein